MSDQTLGTCEGHATPHIRNRSCEGWTADSLCAECGRDRDHFVHGDHPDDNARANRAELTSHDFVEPPASDSAPEPPAADVSDPYFAATFASNRAQTPPAPIGMVACRLCDGTGYDCEHCKGVGVRIPATTESPLATVLDVADATYELRKELHRISDDNDLLRSSLSDLQRENERLRTNAERWTTIRDYLEIEREDGTSQLVLRDDDCDLALRGHPDDIGIDTLVDHATFLALAGALASPAVPPAPPEPAPMETTE
jgi:hypothetical protein